MDLRKVTKYTAHFWLNQIYENNQNQTAEAGLNTMFYASGHHGQYISRLPDYELVIVRLGLRKQSAAWNQNRFVRPI